MYPVWRSFAAATLVLMLGACGDGEFVSSSPAAPTPFASLPPVSEQLQLVGAAESNPARNDPLRGIDANRNGVRDDVEKLVLGFGLPEAPRKATLQFAKAGQVALTASSGFDAAYKNAAEVLRAQVCMASVMPDFATYLSAVRAETLNTDLRRQAWQDFEEKIARLTLPEPEGTVCE